jgi:hypothetical protein
VTLLAIPCGVEGVSSFVGCNYYVWGGGGRVLSPRLRYGIRGRVELMAGSCALDGEVASVSVEVL